MVVAAKNYEKIDVAIYNAVPIQQWLIFGISYDNINFRIRLRLSTYCTKGTAVNEKKHLYPDTSDLYYVDNFWLRQTIGKE